MVVQHWPMGTATRSPELKPEAFERRCGGGDSPQNWSVVRGFGYDEAECSIFVKHAEKGA